MLARIIPLPGLPLLALVIVVAPACERAAPPRAQDTPDQPSAARPEEVWATTTAEILAEIVPLLAPADLVFVGEVVVVQPSFGFWTGFVHSFHVVDYQVVRVLRGDAVSPGDHIEIAHPVFTASRTIARETAALRPSIVAPGKRVLVIAEPRYPRFGYGDEPQWMCAGGNEGMAAASDEIVGAVERALVDLATP